MLRIKVKPPTHKIDVPGVLISEHDCWDMDRIIRERDQLEAQALEEIQAKALDAAREKNPEISESELEAVKASCELDDLAKEEARARHPVDRYHAGKTRFQPDASDWDPAGKPVTARDYLKGEPTEFSIRRLTYQEYHRAHEPARVIQRYVSFLRLTLVEIRSPEGGFCWRAKEGEAPENVLQAIHDAGPLLLVELGSKAMIHNRPLGDEEGKP